MLARASDRGCESCRAWSVAVLSSLAACWLALRWRTRDQGGAPPECAASRAGARGERGEEAWGRGVRIVDAACIPSTNINLNSC